MGRRRRWNDLDAGQKAAVLVLGVAEVVITAVALADLVRRPRSGVRGPKLVWAAGCLVQPVGPIAYLAAGRRRPG